MTRRRWGGRCTEAMDELLSSLRNVHVSQQFIMSRSRLESQLVRTRLNLALVAEFVELVPAFRQVLGHRAASCATRESIAARSGRGLRPTEQTHACRVENWIV